MEEYKTKPVILGDELHILVTDIGEKGDGITRKENFVIITPDTTPGQKYKVKITKVLKNFAFAEKISTTEEEE